VTLRRKIEREIAAQGPIPFSTYMELCLGDPEFGYYSRQAEQFGKTGDFYTSSDVHAVFGRLLARQFEEMWRLLGKPGQIEILELGPGRGLFAQDVLDWSEKKFPEFFSGLHYSLMEKSLGLRSRMQTTLARHFERGKVSLAGKEASAARRGETRPSNGCAQPGSGNSVSQETAAAPRCENTAQGFGSVSDPNHPDIPQERDTIPRALSPEVPLIIFANEFFDALPVEIVSSPGSLRITGHLAETWASASAQELEFLDRYSVQPEAGERLEVPLIAQRYASQAAATIQRGFLVVVDYGYTREEQLAGRHRGSLMTYRQHSASANAYQAPGEQDITAHVNFTAVSSAVKANGLSPQSLLTQSQFLLGIGEANQFADAFEECRLPQERAKVALQLKHLITPTGMGESFRVLIASKGMDSGEVSRLSGLSFGKPGRD
jgi:SAM-dependent MidA family methyltransferase